MHGNKWGGPKYLLLALPFLFILAWLGRLPFLLPAWLAPERLYLCLSSAPDPQALAKALGHPYEVFLALPEGLRAMPRRPSPKTMEALTGLPSRPSIEGILGDLGSGLPWFRRARVYSDQALDSQEILSLEAAAKEKGIALRLQLPKDAVGDPGPGSDPVVALSWRLRAGAQSLAFELLLAPGCKKASRIEIVAGQEGARDGSVLFAGAGKDVAPDLTLRVEAPRAALIRGFRLVIQASPDSPARVYPFQLGLALDEAPKILVIRPQARGQSWFEENWPCVVVSPEEAGGVNFLAYEVVVLDGPSLASIKGRVTEGLEEVMDRKTGSLVFAVDSPDFGRPGDNPPLEALLPVELKPATVRELPALGLLLLLDTSGSMFGTKLSLAKVTGLELLAQLKPEDRVGLMLFSDKRTWVYGFQPNHSIKAAPVVEPLPAQGGTDLATALKEGLTRLEALDLPERHIVIVSDGVTRPADFQALALRARASRISISTMGVGEDADRPLLERLAKLTGGSYYPVVSADEIPSLLFQDRRSLARPPFVQEKQKIYAINGAEVGTVTGMSLLAARPGATVLLADSLGDALLSSKEIGNRGVVVFASDLHGTYTQGLFRNKDGAGIFKDRIEGLFAEKALEVSLLEGRRGVYVQLESSGLVAPRLILSRPGRRTREVALEAHGSGTWGARLNLAEEGGWTAGIADRGLSLGTFGLWVNPGLSGMTPEDALAARSQAPGAWLALAGGEAWLFLAFGAGLGTTLYLRRRR